MISYAQNREDVLLARVFDGPTGFYVDVGAADPVNHSVTKWFYDRGWSGVNLEPHPGFFDLLRADRPRDVNLNVAASNVNGEGTFHEIENLIGSSTLDPALAEAFRTGGGSVRSYPIRTVTLDRVLDAHAPRPLDFVKIDVEGHERDVLLGFDLGRWRPRVLVVEATRPNSPVASHGDWEPIVLAQGYCYAFFDGLNRYYVRPEDEALIPILAVPPNPFDNYVPYPQAQAVRAAEDLDARLAATGRRAEQLESRLAAAHRHADQVQGELTAARADLAGARADLAAAEYELARERAATVPRAALDTARAILAATRDHLGAVQSAAQRRAG